MKQSQIIQWSLTTITMTMVLCSCYPYTYTAPYYVDLDRQKENHYYVPEGVNAPLLANKNDMSISASASAGGEIYGGSIHAAYVASKNFGLMMEYSKLSNDADIFIDDVGYQKHFQFGAGYVNKLSDHWLFETYGGLGSGKMENYHETGNSTIKSSNYFLQPAIAYGGKDQVFQIGFISRFNMVNFNLGDTSFDNDREPFVTSQMKLIADNPSHVFWEPGIVLRGGWTWIGLQAGYQLSADLSNKGLRHANDNFSIGVICRFNTAKKK